MIALIIIKKISNFECIEIIEKNEILNYLNIFNILKKM